MNFLGVFSKNDKISSFMKIRPVGVKLFHAKRWTDGQTDRQTDTTNLIVACRNFANAPKIFHLVQGMVQVGLY